MTTIPLYPITETTRERLARFLRVYLAGIKPHDYDMPSEAAELLRFLESHQERVRLVVEEAHE